MPQLAEGNATVASPNGTTLIKLDEHKAYTQHVQVLLSVNTSPGCPDFLYVDTDTLMLLELKDYAETTENDFITGLISDFDKTAIKKFVGGLLSLQIMEKQGEIQPVSTFTTRKFRCHIQLPDINQANFQRRNRRNNSMILLNNQADVIRRKLRPFGFSFAINNGLGNVVVSY